jgi:ubiquinone/menaquinone biosynthesis C-methylase UbiE
LAAAIALSLPSGANDAGLLGQTTSVDLRDAWERNAADWLQWARTPDHDSYWRFHRRRFFELVPPPGRRTLDVGCGEGRVSRDLQAAGHRTVGVDASPTMIDAAREADPAGEYVVADAASLPFADAYADLVVAFMSLQDVDDMAAAVREAARILEPGGGLVLAVVHPINSGHQLDREHPEGRLVMTHDYFERRIYRDQLERDGLRMTFESRHWTLGDYFDALLRAGFRIEALREIGQEGHPKWSRYPLFLHIRATKAPLAVPPSGRAGSARAPV